MRVYGQRRFGFGTWVEMMREVVQRRMSTRETREWTKSVRETHMTRSRT
ncbi:hypothetical protein HSB1_45330 [Halogranum salarium B-1]|uniref:Uncharacterized protein n=1 Tax=Halogranum salarium B-1 TaxID=1210908 RepID=J3ESZ9_9EURY|nr:hypothetical protein HSB1_45330 [Halogranum salarium B-1]